MCDIDGDNQGAIALAKNPVAHARTKYIDIRYHYIHEAVQGGVIDLQYCPTKEINADLLTKPLPKGQFEKLRLSFGRFQLLNQPIKWECNWKIDFLNLAM